MKNKKQQKDKSLEEHIDELYEFQQQEKKDDVNQWTAIGINYFHTFQYDREEGKVIFGFDGLIGHDEVDNGMFILTEQQVRQMVAYLNYRLAELEWKRNNI